MVCGISLIKYSLIIFNLIFVFSGVAVILASGMVLGVFINVRHFLGNYILAPPVVLIVVAASVFAVALFGCCGAIRESYFLLVAYAVCLVAIFIAELAVGIAAAVYKNKVKQLLTTALRKSMERYRTNSPDRAAWDYIQPKYKCCGIYEPSDWQLYGETPEACCNTDEGGSKLSQYCLGIAKGKYMYQTGCFSELEVVMYENQNILMAVGLGVAFVEVVGIVLSCWLATAIKQREEEEVA